MSKCSILITQPDFDSTTRYISTWSAEVEEFSKNKGNKTMTLKGKRVTRSEVESIIKKVSPQLIMLNGHGNDQEVGGQDNEVILDDQSNEEVLKDKIIYALSCSAAKVLGFNCIKRGAKTFIGYKKDYIFLHSHSKISRPRDDKRAALFFKPSNLIPISLLKGNSANNSYIGSKNLLKKTIVNLLNSETYNEDRVCLRYLVWNYTSLALIGDGDAKV